MMFISTQHVVDESDLEGIEEISPGIWALPFGMDLVFLEPELREYVI